MANITQCMPIALDEVNYFLEGAWHNPAARNVYVFTTHNHCIEKVHITCDGCHEPVEFDSGVMEKDGEFYFKVDNTFIPFTIYTAPHESIAIKTSQHNQMLLFRMKPKV